MISFENLSISFNLNNKSFNQLIMTRGEGF